jgi:branched-chain amino acid transport system ATP-binding protein
VARETLLEVSSLHAGYGALPVLRGVDLVVGAGEVVAVLGANGVGKTTLNNVISGLIRPTSGSVRFLGERIDTRSPAKILFQGLVHVPEGRKIFPNMSVRENLELGSYRRGRDQRADNLERIFALFPRLRERMGQMAGTLSGGEQQMLAIGRGLMGMPKLLILDEPSLGLSPLLVEELFTLIKQIAADGLAILLVEQNVVQSLDVAERAYVLENGAVAMAGPSAELKTNAELARTYLGL